MKVSTFVFCFLAALQASAADEVSTITHSSSASTSSLSLTTQPSAVLSTNLAGLSQSQANISVDVMISAQAAATLNYSSQSEKETRPKLANQPKLTVDRTRFGVGADFYLKPLASQINVALSPTLLFGSEKDAVNTESENGVGLRLVGIFKPVPRLMAQGGFQTTVIGSETKTDLQVGMGLLF